MNTERKLMRHLALTMMAAMILLMGLGHVRAADPEGFYTDYDEAVKAAREQNKPLYLHFTTTWCSWCRKIENDIYANPEGRKLLENFVPASLDCTVPKGEQPTGKTRQNIELMQEYGGNGFPYLVMTTADGVVLNHFSGYKPMPAFQQELQDALSRFEEFQKFREFEKTADRDSLEYNRRALDFYSTIGRWDQAAKAAENLRRMDPEGNKTDPAQIDFALYMKALIDDTADPNEQERLAQRIRQADPKNKKGYLEKMVWMKAMHHYHQAARAARQRNRDRFNEQMETIVSLLGGLTDEAATLQKGQDIYALLGVAHAQLDHPEQAVEALEKAIQADPESPAVKQFRQMIDKIRNPQAQPTGQGG
jgi:protein disulfide-isomerase